MGTAERREGTTWPNGLEQLKIARGVMEREQRRESGKKPLSRNQP